MKQQTRLIGEFLLIVVGVLVALGVETALEERKDDELRDEYIVRIKLDVESDKRAIGGRIEFFTAVQAFSNELLRWLDTDAPVNHDILLASFYAAELWPFVPNQATYEDLLSTGNIRLLDDLELRTRLSAYHDKAHRSRSGWVPTENYRVIIRGMIPSDIQGMIRENCPTTDALDDLPTGFPPCDLPGIDYAELTALYEPLKTNPGFRRTLTYRGSELAIMVYLLEQQVKFADEVLTRIDRQD